MKFILLFLVFNIYLSALDITIVLQKDIYDDLNKFLGNKSPFEITDFSGRYSRRDVAEVIMLLQALKLGGLEDFNYTFLFSPTDRRDLAYLDMGKATIRGTSIWKNEAAEFSKNMFISVASIEASDFEAGFYTAESNTDVLETNTVESLYSKTIVSSKFWSVDWETLSNSHFKRLENVAKWESMVNLVNKKRIDLLLAPFQPTPDLSFEAYGHKFLPVKGFKIGLKESRHFVVSKLDPNGYIVFTALNEGLKEMKKKGYLNKVYTESGFYNEKVKDWIKVE